MADARGMVVTLSILMNLGFAGGDAAVAEEAQQRQPVMPTRPGTLMGR